MKRIFFLVLLISTVTVVSAKIKIKEALPEKIKTTDHYIGLQANFLIRELFNFGGSSTSAGVNPYGFIYHLNSKKSGVGLRVGLGPSIYNVTNIDGLVTIKSKGHRVNARIGIDKRITIDDRWEGGIGLDAVIVSAKDETKNDQLNTQGFITQTATTTMNYGGGPMAYLRYHLRPRILLGTEASFYYLTGKNNNKSTFIDEFGQVLSESDDEDKSSLGQLSLPISIYILVKF